MRDGGYYNDWDFSDKFVRDYLATVRSIDVEYVELGFRFLRSSTHKGPWAYSPENKIKEFELPASAKFGVMINASEFDEEASSRELRRMFETDNSISFVRIATHYEDLHLATIQASTLRQFGLEVGVNLMQASERSLEDISSFADAVLACEADFVYLADSLGAMSDLEVSTLVKHLSGLVDIPIGIHAHDNKGKAAQNSIAALESGATLVDGTILGMGRGAGNAKTEDLILELQEKRSSKLEIKQIVTLGEFLKEHMEPLIQKYRWGGSLPYRLAATWGIHPTFVQEMLDENAKPDTVFQTLFNLKDRDSSRYNPQLLQLQEDEESKNSYSSKMIISANFRSQIGKDVFIIGPGLNKDDQSSQIVRLALDRNGCMLKLNDTPFETPSYLPSFRVAAHGLRLNSLGKEFWESADEKIIPALPQNKNIRHDEKISIIPKMFEDGFVGSGEHCVIVPNDLTLSFALAVSCFLGAESIFLAGIEGYEGSDPRNSEIARTLDIFESSQPTIKLISFSQSKFPVKFVSPFWSGLDPSA